MATPTTLNIGEPADEQSVDSNSKPQGAESEYGDHDVDSNRTLENELNNVHLPSYPDYEYEADMSPDFAAYSEYRYPNPKEKYYVNQEEDHSCGNLSIQKLTLKDVFFKIMPSVGAASYEYFSLKITSPSWFLRAFSGVEQTVSNVLWLQAHVGIGFYVFSRRHFSTLPMSRRMLYSTFGSFLFNYGSCLFWALGRNYLPHLPALHVAFGLVTGGILLYVGQDYLHYIDTSCSEVE